MVKSRAVSNLQRPWTTLAAVGTAAHHGFELSQGVGLVSQPELGLWGAGALWGTQIPAWVALAARGGRRWDKVLAVWSGAALGGVVVHFLLWPWRCNKIGLPVLTEAEGIGASRLPAYNAILRIWFLASAMSIAREISPRDRKWALVGFATLPLLRRSAKHHFSWIVDEAATNAAWWNRGIRQD
jgi:hypothetical protein